MSEVLSCSHLAKSYTDANSTLHVLRDIDLTIRQGEQVAIMGASGSGKSTLLHLLGGLDTPTGGLIRIDGTPIERLNAVTLGRLRNRALGFIYQFHHLLPEFTALENVAMPLLVRGLSSAKAADEAGRMLERVGLSSMRPASSTAFAEETPRTSRGMATFSSEVNSGSRWWNW